MNKKGFTLVELIAVLVIIAIISLIAVPNVINLMDTSTKSEYAADANTLIAKAKYMDNLEKYNGKFKWTSDEINKMIRINDIVNVGDLKSPKGKVYDGYINFTIEEGVRIAEIYLTDGMYQIGTCNNPQRRETTKIEADNVVKNSETNECTNPKNETWPPIS